MDFAAITNPIPFTLWLCAYFLCALCFYIKRGAFVVAFGAGCFTVAAVIVTLVYGATLAETGTELLILVLICLIARGCRK